VTWVKLCSIKSEADIQAVIEAQPDAAGFLVGQRHHSADFISPAKAKELARLLPHNITPILVTHLANAEDIAQLATETQISTIQLHGGSSIQETIKLRRRLPGDSRLIYAAHVTETGCSITIDDYSKHVDMLLLDSCNPDLRQVGGTGKTHDWNISAEIVQNTELPVILAGGLNPNNVADAVKTVKPFGVDVNSGVKDRDGFRSPALCKKFVANAKAAGCE